MIFSNLTAMLGCRWKVNMTKISSRLFPMAMEAFPALNLVCWSSSAIGHPSPRHIHTSRRKI